ncbi:glycoside hydrolase family 95 protein [Microlunatus soli]|uniref:Alpha-L-fucosidase 2 n=1 Tax=Microlunatus soli TaxID=630515 RepID=A0A1H1M8D1_9ACTN|nr:glycoside hydrolase family 95 protein [Microlunatus soli]SDR82996.1 alpha-L-fucosidase 2 [Microlunatus soli]
MPTAPSPRLRYRTPARYWTDALPIGNGRLGAMIFGQPDHDRWQLNDDTCWSGSPQTTVGEPATDQSPAAAVARARRLLLDGQPVQAEDEIKKVQFGHSQAYQPLADLEIINEDGHHRLTTRELDLGTAVAGWQAEGAEAEVFASAPANAILGSYRWDTAHTVRLRLTAAHREYGHSRLTVTEDRVVVSTRMPSDVYPARDHRTKTVVYDDRPGVSAVVVAAVRTDGTVSTDADSLIITGATRLRIALTTETDFVDPRTTPHGDIDRLTEAAGSRAADLLQVDHDQLRAAHLEEYRSWSDRFDLVLGGTAEDATVDTLLERARSGDVAPGLVALMVHYGRYLMISASRPGSRAINLQGIWNPWIQPPWHSNYTVNINTEMNYWPATVANLAECAEPLFDLVETAAATGAATATSVYDRPGWTAHHNTDVWGFTLPVGNGTAKPSWASWPMAGFWLLRHFREQYAFTGDDAFLIDRTWPLLDGAVSFGLATLCQLPDGTLGVAPSTSPENQYLARDRDGTEQPIAVTVSSTMDIALLRDTFAFWQQAAAVVAEHGRPVDADRAADVATALERLPLPRPTERGSYPEWLADLPEAEPEHRHQSHLYDLFPGDAVTGYDPTQADLLAAMAETLRLRGDYSTGWSLAWRLCLHARLRDADAATRSLGHFLSPVSDEIAAAGPAVAQAGGVYRNLFCAHPPFQIDGNFGATAGVIEMLIQSHGRIDGLPVVEMLPCLPVGWPEGRLTGVRARGGLTVDLAWSAGRLSTLRITADRDHRFLLRVPGRADRRLDLAAGQLWGDPDLPPAGR